MANQMYPDNYVFCTGTGTNLNQEYFLEAERLRAKQTNNRPAWKNPTTEKDSVVGRITLHVKVGISNARVIFGAIHSSALAVLLETSLVDRFLNVLFSPKRRESSIVLSQYQFSPSKKCQNNAMTRKRKMHKM